MFWKKLQQKVTEIAKILFLKSANESFKENTNLQLDPYLIGKIVGGAAFSSGDYVVIVKQGKNYPAKVRCRNDDLAQSVKVILGDETDSIYGFANYFGDDLGYPLHRKLWSEHQKLWYEKCHQEEYLRQRWLRITRI